MAWPAQWQQDHLEIRLQSFKAGSSFRISEYLFVFYHKLTGCEQGLCDFQRFHITYTRTFWLSLVPAARARKIQSGEEKVLTDNRYWDQEQDRGGVRNIIILRINWRRRYTSQGCQYTISAVSTLFNLNCSKLFVSLGLTKSKPWPNLWSQPLSEWWIRRLSVAAKCSSFCNNLCQTQNNF